MIFHAGKMFNFRPILKKPSRACTIMGRQLSLKLKSDPF